MTINISDEMVNAIESALRYDVKKRGVRNYGSDGIVNFPNPGQYLVSNQDALDFFTELAKQQ